MPEGLRARKKRATLTAIERTAVRLALEKGHAKVTVPEICEGADISRSTFFNYMPHREAAIFGRPLIMVPWEEAWALMEEHAPQSLLRGLYEVALASVGGAEVNREVAAGRQRLGMEQPDCTAQMLAPFVTLSTAITGLLYVWLDADPERRHLPEASVLRESVLTVSMVGTALQTMLSEMVGSEDTTLGHEIFSEVMAQAGQVIARLDTPSGAPSGTPPGPESS